MSEIFPIGETSGLSADMVTREIRKMILTGQIGVGVHLKQDALAKRFGVSRIPVREALKRLQAEGLIEHTPHHGAVVPEQPIPYLLEMLDIRLALEIRALKLAIPLMTDQDFLKASEILKRYDESESPREWSELNMAFHMSLYVPCGRLKLLKLIEDTVMTTSLQLRAKMSSTTGRKNPQREHVEILEACVARDVKRAVDTLEEHIEHTQIALRKLT